MTTTNDDLTIRVTDDLVIELWPAAPGDRADRPMLKLRSLAAGQDGEGRVAVVYLNEVRRLVAALVEGACSGQVGVRTGRCAKERSRACVVEIAFCALGHSIQPKQA